MNIELYVIEQQKQFLSETGTWMQHDAFVEEICIRGDYTKPDVESKLDELIKNQKIELMRFSTKIYINFDSASSHYLEEQN